MESVLREAAPGILAASTPFWLSGSFVLCGVGGVLAGLGMIFLRPRRPKR